MLSEQEFARYVEEHILDCLPYSFDGGEVKTEKTLKGRMLAVKEKGVMIAPVIYLDEYYERYLETNDIDHVLSDIADYRVELNRFDVERRRIEADYGEVEKALGNYDLVKENLFTRLIDHNLMSEIVKEGSITTMPFNDDLDISYKFKVGNVLDGVLATTVTNTMLDSWGVSVEKLHEDAVANEYKKHFRMLGTMDLIGEKLIQGNCGTSVLDYDLEYAKARYGREQFLVLMGAESEVGYSSSAILRKDVLKQIGNIFESDYFVLPSSVNELIIVPDNNSVDKDFVCSLTSAVNEETKISMEEFLSNEVQYYDRKHEVVVNAKEHLHLVDAHDKTVDDLDF